MKLQDEKGRLAALKAYDILDTLPEEDLDALVQLASEICNTPIALISLVDAERQWFKANKGLDGNETPRNISFCQYAIGGEGVYEVENAADHPLFASNPLVTGQPEIRFYAGAPLATPDGYNIGTLCVIDTQPKLLTESQKNSLSVLSKLVMSQFELRKTREELRSSREHYRDIIERATDIIYTCNVRGEFTFISPAVERIVGYSSAELLGKHFSCLVAPDHAEQVRLFYKEQFEKRIEESRLEFPVITTSGEVKWVEQTVRLLVVNNSRESFHGVVRDVSERKKNEALIREKDRLFAVIFHSSPAGMVVFALDTVRLIEVNKGFCELSGYTEQEMKELPPEQREIIAPEDRERLLDEFRKKGAVKNRDLRITDKNGNSKDVIYSAHIIDLGTPERLGLAVFYDITEQKKLEAAVKERDTRFYTMFRGGPVAMSLGSLQPYQFIETNESFSVLTGYSHGELTAPGFFTNGGLVGEDERKIMREAFAAQGRLLNHEAKIRCRNGDEKYILLSSQIVHIAGQALALSVYHDISQRKILEQQLVVAKEQAEESGRTKEQFLANMSHEIRTPMNAVLGFTDQLTETKLSKHQKEYVDAIAASGRSLMAIINDILDYSKIEAGMLAMEQVPLSIRSIFSSLFIAYNAEAKKKRLKLTFTSDKLIPEVLTGDPVRLTQIITNLVGNAIKFTNRGSIAVEASLIRSSKNKPTVRFTVTDTGIGIPADKLDSVFERFNQGRNDTARHYGGTGLGLSIVRKLAELQGGTVSVKSRAGKGSVFTVTIPYGMAAVKQTPGKTVRKTAAVKTGSVLLVEDNRLNQKLADTILRSFGFKTTIAANGKIAVAKLKKEKFDVVLMDMQMPVMNGYEATLAIRKQLKSHVPIIAMTAHAMASERTKCLELGMNDYIPKPFRKEELYEKISSVLSRENVQKKPAKKKAAPRKKEQILDLSFLEELAGGDTAFVKDILGIFVTDVPAELKKIKKALAANDFETIKNVAHKLKSSVMPVGLTSLTATLQETETLAGNGKNLPLIRKRCDLISNVLTAAVKEARLVLKG